MNGQPEYAALSERVAAIDGWMSSDQGERLFDAARRCRTDGQIVEIGSFRGKSTVVLASAAPERVTVVAIDPHAGNDRGPQEIDGFEQAAATDYEAFVSNLASFAVADRVRHLRCFSDVAHDEVAGDIDVLYIDGAHRYGPARQDIDEWGARVADGGTMLIHDSFSSIGVTMAIGRSLMLGRRFRYVGRSRSLAEYRAELGGRGRVANAARQLAQLPWFVRNVALKVLLSIGLGKAMHRLGRNAPEWPY